MAVRGLHRDFRVRHRRGVVGAGASPPPVRLLQMPVWAEVAFEAATLKGVLLDASSHRLPPVCRCRVSKPYFSVRLFVHLAQSWKYLVFGNFDKFLGGTMMWLQWRQRGLAHRWAEAEFPGVQRGGCSHTGGSECDRHHPQRVDHTRQCEGHCAALQPTDVWFPELNGDEARQLGRCCE